MCGILGVSGLDGASRIAQLGLYALQHRGQESAGIVAVDPAGQARVHRGMGLVSDVFSESRLAQLTGDVAVGHARYSTAGSTVLANAQPYLVNYHEGPLSVAHNGNLTNATALREELVRAGAIFQSSSDTEVLIHLIARSSAPTVESQIRDALEQVEGACTVVISAGRTLYAAVDSRGFRPLVWGRIGQGVVIASETCALDLVGATDLAELAPGDFVRIEDGLVTQLAPLAPRPRSRCIFELVYFARPDSRIFDRSVDGARRELGRALARHHAAPGADVVFSVPDSANVMALGYSEVSGVKLEHALIRNHYVGRTFIHPTQSLRVAKVKIKFNPVREIIAGRSVVVIDDSLVRGTTSKGLVQMIRGAGAREVHLRLGSPPITGPCHYGIDTPTSDELIAANHSTEAIREYLGVDTLEYLTLDEMVDAAGPRTGWCHACFSGAYPTEIPTDLARHRHDAPPMAASA
ncbi:MAG: amidophosphoribosyltransferase [Gemmatimonadetes bacterium]|nr:amidophosphoribosyltransferase [Gemmatimonadota bacterium]MCB9517473.1 amidophosphoribosyltransferase [Gemmatimonadales bacterium]MCA9761570.1 amidophosphoribosyltransferase [Gemmatimonadota bacterium]MCA9767564.1 amidophosphoribosyltransferase [Gemmatimonadota bacterium]HPF60900.1 amidophosphoribosyltransferase [Gemmatimonadales bacterium]